MLGINFRRLNRFSGLVNRDLVGVDFGSRSLKLAHMRISPGKKELIGIVSKNISGLGDEDVSRILRSSFIELKVTAPYVINTIPPHLVITKNIEIPSVDPQEIREIMNLQAGRHTPYSRDEIIVDYINVGTYKHNYSKILLLIVANNVIKRQMAILDKAGFKSEKVLFSSEGIAWMITKIFQLEALDTPMAVLHIDDSFTDFSVIYRGKVIFIRSIPMGAEQLTGSEDLIQERFVEEIKHSLEVYQNEDIERSPNALILTGAIEEVIGLDTQLNNVLHLPTRVVSYFKNFPISDESVKAESLVKRQSFFNIIASLLAGEEMKVSLIPENLKLTMVIEERGRDLIKTGIFVLIIFILIFSILITKIYSKGLYLKKLDTEYLPLNQKAKSLENDFTKASLIRNYLLKRGYSLEVLSEIYNIIPSEAEVDEIRYDAEGKLSIRGTSELMSSVFSFVESMEKSKYFKNVKTKYTTKRKDGLKDVTDFEITSSLDDKGA